MKVEHMLLFLFGLPMATTLLAAPPEGDERSLLQQLLLSDQQIQDFQLHVMIEANGHPFNDVDWGYDRGKEFFSGKLFSHEKGKTDWHHHIETQAFDGEKMYSFTDQTINGVSRRNGRVASLRNEIFRACPNVRTLLGSDLRYETRETMGEVIGRAVNIKVRPEPEAVNGDSCRVLELIGVDRLADGRVFDALVWIDAERGYRPLRYEKYRDWIERTETEDRFVRSDDFRWKLQYQRVDNVQLKNIDGIWFPVYGEVQQFGNDLEPAPGVTQDDLKAIHSTEEALAKRMLVVKSRPLTLFTVRVDPATVRLNKGVPKERFSIHFPDGTQVHDALLGIDYVAGGPLKAPPGPSQDKEPK